MAKILDFGLAIARDVHALGIIVLEMLTGPIEQRGPFFVHSETILSERLEGEGHSDAERGLAAILRQAFSPAKEDRYGSVQKFRKDVLPAIEQLGRDSGFTFAARSTTPGQVS